MLYCTQLHRLPHHHPLSQRSKCVKRDLRKSFGRTRSCLHLNRQLLIVHPNHVHRLRLHVEGDLHHLIHKTAPINTPMVFWAPQALSERRRILGASIFRAHLLLLWRLFFAFKAQGKHTKEAVIPKELQWNTASLCVDIRS
jgi:hypothetical protein